MTGMQGVTDRPRRYIAAVAAAYLRFGMAWIVRSDALLAFVLGLGQMQRLPATKPWVQALAATSTRLRPADLAR